MSYYKIEIKFPIWNGELKKRCVGVADYRVKGDLEIHINYVNKHGVRSYPNPFRISADEVRKFPLKQFNGFKAYIIPLEAMTEVSE